MRKTNETPRVKTRNLLHDHPLMRKCEAHEKTGKAKRRQQKITLRREWPVQTAFA